MAAAVLVEPASPNSKGSRSRQRSSRSEALLLGALLLVVGFLVGRQTLQSESANLILAGAGFDPSKWPLRGGGSPRSSSRAASALALAGTAPKAYYLPAELGVHHYTVSGKLEEDGVLVVLHLWLVMTRQPVSGSGSNGTITMQGYGFFQPINTIIVWPGGELISPLAAAQALEQEGFLYIEQRLTDRRFNISTRVNPGSRRSPFHMTVTLPADVEPPGIALDFHVQDWRRFLELPVDHMLAVQPNTDRGRYRVAVWMTPEMTGPQAARLVALHTQYHVGALGFHEEQVYMHPDQLAHCLRDEVVMDLVNKAQLKLVLIDNFPEIFTFAGKKSIGFNSSLTADDNPIWERIEMHGNQVLVNAHILLANLGSDAFVFSVDLDEYLITEKRTTLPELVEGCLGNRTSRMARMNVVCTDCEENTFESDMWLDRSRPLHPLAFYRTPVPLGDRPSTKTLVKPDDAWSFDVHSALVWEDRVQGDYRDALACGAKLLHVFNMFRLRAPRDHDASNDTVTYLWPLENLAGA